MSKEATPPRGTRDILPAEAALRDAVTARILDTYRLFGFDRMETPAIEALSRLERSEGGDNTKLIFKIMKRGEKLEGAQASASPDAASALADLGLRFDLTVPLARYYANNRDGLPATFKAVQIGPVWRAERPQKGRFRQFVQCDIDVFGSAAPLVESELLIACGQALHSVGLTGFTVRLNDRRILAAIARDGQVPDDRFNQFCVTVDKADKIGMSGVYDELRATGIAPESVARLETLFTRLASAGTPDVQQLRELLHDPANLPKSTANDLAAIKTLVEKQLTGKGTVAYDFTLVRGMGYYSGPIFEFGFRDYPYSIAGGGRYDGMVKNPNGTPVPACGLSIGFERIITILQDLGSDLGTPGNKVAILITPATPLAAALDLQQSYIGRSTPAAILYKAKNFSHQLDQLATAKFREFVTVDDTGHPSPAKSLVRDSPQKPA